MSATEVLVRLAAGVVLTFGNAFFVVTEFALTRLRQLPREEFQDEPALRRAWKMTERLEIYLTSCQVGISLTSILLGIVTEPAVTSLLEPLFEAVGLSGRPARLTSVVVAVVILNLIHKIWGEQAPTYLGVERPKQVARRTAVPHFWWTRAMYPVIYLGDGLAKATLRLFGVPMSRSWIEAEEAPAGEERPEKADARRRPASYPEIRREMGALLSRGELPEDRRREVLRALEIDRIPVREIMVPRDEIVAVSTEHSAEENLETLRQGNHARYPLVGASLDDLRGILYLPRVFRRIDEIRAGEVGLDEVAAPPLTVPPDLPVSRLIDRFQDARQELALVAEEGEGEGGGGQRIVGLVTVTEAFEVIAGEVEDPYD